MYNNKTRLLYLIKILFENTDAEHYLTLREIISKLSLYSINAERKTLYNDFEILRNFGIDIEYNNAKERGYYIASRDFEIAELKLLVDAIQSSKFITSKKSLMLIKKLEKLVSKNDAAKLQRAIFVNNRVKSMNESVFYNVDSIHTAINQNNNISFLYFDYNYKKEKIFRNNKAKYLVSPYALSWTDENYYMICYDINAKILKHFRVDKMCSISILNSPRIIKDSLQKFDLGEYNKKIFGMFQGKEEYLTLNFDNSLSGVVIDRFGKNIPMIPDNDTSFHINVTLQVSPQFFGWISAFGNKAKIISPEYVKKEYIKTLKSIINNY